jgi:hypothetical protein
MDSELRAMMDRVVHDARVVASGDYFSILASSCTKRCSLSV